ncbi:Exocyst complex component S5 [Xanthoria calcicola]
MTTHEHTLLNHYNITNLFPIAWPAEKDESDASEDEKLRSKPQTGRLAHQRSNSRYSVLARSTSDRRSLVPGSEKTGDGLENLVQKDEPDPLGGPDSVVRILRHRGLPVEEDQRLRNRFLLSSTTFSPTLYLSQVHSNASTESLLQGLDFLSKSIDQKSASLKVLVESNFERFVRAKTTIDNVYAEMRNQGAETSLPQRPRAHSRAHSHSRIKSKGSAHFRNTSGQGPFSPRGIDKPLPSDKKKHALSKESEYGVQGIKGPLSEVAVKAEEIWGPALGGREREESLRMAVASIEKSSGILEVDAAIGSCIKRKKYDELVVEYKRARQYAEDARAIANGASSGQRPLTDPELYQIVITGRMWSGVETQIDNFKRDTWRRLTNAEAPPPTAAARSVADEHMALINVLLELGVQDNPIWFWLLSRYDHLKNKIIASFERSRVEIEILRRRLANADPPPTATAVAHLKRPGTSHDRTQPIDSPSIIEMWELVYGSLNNLLAAPDGLLGEIIDFWERAQAFLDGSMQATLPVGPNGQSRKHHRLSTEGVRELQKGVLELIEILRGSVFSFLADPPIEDVSMLYSPLPPTTPSTPKSAIFAPYAHQDSRFKFDASNPPPPSPKTGEAWQAFAFWPPCANTVGGVQYLEKILNLVGAAASELARLPSVSSSSTVQRSLKTLVAGTRERCSKALMAAWIRDVEMFHLVENWERAGDRRDLTKMPAYFLAFEHTVLSGLQKIVYIPDVASRANATDVVTAPPAELLRDVRRHFEKTLYTALSDMVRYSEMASSPKNPQQSETMSSPPLTIAGAVSGAPQSREIRLLLTMGNMQLFRTDLVPQLVAQFETNFSHKLTEEAKTIKVALGQIEDKLFKSYAGPFARNLGSMIHSGITSSSWVPTTDRPTELRPYVYEALLLLVNIHTEVTTTAPPLLLPIISYLFEQIVLAFLAAFRARTERYTLAALMQATLDVEFVASILSQYTTAKASELQSEVYQELDQRTDNSARMRLQNELPEMRAILKKLRDGTRGEFMCFKKQRTAK